MARLPGVWPRQAASSQAGSSHSTKNAASSTTPQPARPNWSAAKAMIQTMTTRITRSMAQAIARATGPARWSVSSMPSGVATRRVVSSIPPPKQKSGPGPDFFAAFLSPAHGVEELAVRLGGLQLVDQEFGRLELVHREQQLPQHPHLLQDRRLDQQLLAPRARAVHVDGGVDALLVHPPVGVDLHLAGALELLADHVTHPAAGVDQRRRYDRQRAAFLDVA